MRQCSAIAIRVNNDEAYRAIVKLVGYAGTPCPLSPEKTDELNKRFGKERLMNVAAEVIEYDSSASPPMARLKPEIRKLCFGILGPTPEDEHWYYREGEQPTMKAEEKPAEAPAEPRRWMPPPEMTPEAMIAKLKNDELAQLITDCKWAIDHYGSRSRKSRPFKKDLALAETELKRRQPERSIDEVAEAPVSTIAIETGCARTARREQFAKEKADVQEYVIDRLQKAIEELEAEFRCHPNDHALRKRIDHLKHDLELQRD